MSGEMLDSFFIGSYRGLKETEFKDFSDINILVGENNVGKTSVLEALILSGLFDEGELLIQTLISRYQQISLELVKDMFEDQDKPLVCLKRKMKDSDLIAHTHIRFREDEKTVLSGEQMRQEKSLMLEFDYNFKEENKKASKHHSNYAVVFEQHGQGIDVRLGKRKDKKFQNDAKRKIPCEFISFSRFDRTAYLMDSLDAVLEQDKRAELIEVLKLFDPEVENFEVIGKDRNIKIFAKNRKQPLSLYDYGNGMYKAFYIASAALLCENGIFLVDEIEAGIHKKALKKFIHYLMEVCKQRNIQLFITTHSLETLDLFLENKEERNRIVAYNMKNQGTQTKVRRYSGEKLEQLRRSMGLDIR